MSAYLGDGIDALAGTRKYLSTQFWTELFEEFGLSLARFSGVSDFEEAEPTMPRGDLM